ncbi:MAG: GH25 family lysozyme, partial [Bacteroidota bacterium]
GKINWAKLAADGHDFVFIKASEGRELQDDFFRSNWEQAGKYGLRRGAYHFFRPEVSPAKQAGNYFDQVNLEPGDLPPVLDVEDRGKLSPQELVVAIKTWADMMENRYGVKPIIYTGQNFYNRYLAGQLNAYPLWLARYDQEEPVTVCGRSYRFWQYTDAGRLPGIKGDVDRNVFFGTHLDLALLCIPPPAKKTDDLARIGE